TPNLLSSVDMEARVRASGLDWVILRGGLFYGPDTSRWEQWNAEAKQRRLALPGDGADYASLIHVDDMAEAVVLATDSAVARVTLNIVDDAPVTYATLFAHIARLHGAPPPTPGGPRGAAMASFRVANTRAREALGWTLRFPDYQRGWTVG
ncbi:MAG TPA: NAD-dependent epimerase/dehydratase family protein, partial [Gemmatimonadaceae bacterium]